MTYRVIQGPDFGINHKAKFDSLNLHPILYHFQVIVD